MDMSLGVGLLLFLLSIPIYCCVMLVIFWAEQPYTDTEKKIYNEDNALTKFKKILKS